jgi:hypothetical protein
MGESTKEASADVSRIWNCWTENMLYTDGEPGYIIHAFDIDRKDPRTFCGVRFAESGMLDLTEFEPGCMKCRRILHNRGLMNRDN